MTEFQTRDEYLATHLGEIDDTHGLAEYGLLNHGRGAHITQPLEDADQKIPLINQEITTIGGAGPMYKDGGLALTNQWKKGENLVMRVEIDSDYEEVFRVVDRLQALPYFDQESIYIREPPEQGMVSFELEINYNTEIDDREDIGDLDQDVWRLLDDYSINQINHYTTGLQIICHPTKERFSTQ